LLEGLGVPGICDWPSIKSLLSPESSVFLLARPAVLRFSLIQDYEMHIVHSPTSALFINLERFTIYTNIAPPCVTVFDHHQGALLSLAKVTLEHLCPYRLCGGVAACLQ
jgi:hypothetical protein